MAPATRYAKTRVASTPAPSKRRPAAVETAEPEQRASRSRVTRDGKFTSLEMNGYGRGNRPVRAVVNAATVKRILGLDLRTSGDRAIRAFRGTNEYAVGSKHSRRREDAAAAPQNLRTRSVVPLKVVENFFKSSGGVDGLEARLLETLFVPHCDRSLGVLTAYDDGTLRPHGLYKKEDYRLIGALTFVDPPGSPAQHNHEDIAGCDRDAIWNVVFPLKLDRPAQIAATEFQRDGGKSMDEGEATLWDAGWLHRGLGNATSTERVFLHLVVAPSARPRRRTIRPTSSAASGAFYGSTIRVSRRVVVRRDDAGTGWSCPTRGSGTSGACPKRNANCWRTWTRRRTRTPG